MAIFDLPYTDTTVGQLALPAGNFLIQAKIWLYHFAPELRRGHCSLSTGRFEPEDDGELSLSGGSFASGALSLLATATLAGPTIVTLNCRSQTAGKLNINKLRVTAITLDSLINQ